MVGSGLLREIRVGEVGSIQKQVRWKDYGEPEERDWAGWVTGQGAGEG